MSAPKGKRVYLTWTDEMDNTLLDVLPHVYNAAIKNVRDKCNVEITMDNITSRCKTFDKHYEIISKILSQSGFDWDLDNNKLSMDSDDVWNRYVECNKAAACYKTKVVKNWDAICTIYSIDHANGQGARIGAEDAQDSPEQDADASPDLPPKRQRTGDAILYMLGDMKTSFNDALKSIEPLPMPQVTPPAEILAALQMIPDLDRCDMLKSYGKLILNERLFQALMELPMDMRKEWLLMLNEKNSN
ncbi:hypothetical protein PVAP13_3KG176300 [Panicum virgatum]|uniref:Myb/SANT-like domain-containing protein n=1 Tax=Panicum virgatum TaxID=38727 RepID=A0A8T0UL62_PANVG|nr:hypothetical protein PVAP13_3KG176300 [Panicum virgatum]